MDPVKRRALRNAASVIESLKPGEMIGREELIDRLRAADFPENGSTVLHRYRYHVLRGGIANAEAVVTYPEAADLAEITIEAVRQAAYRGSLTKLGVYDREGRERSGVTLRSLAEWRGWSQEQFEAAALQVSESHG